MIPAKETAAGTLNRFGSEGRELVAQVGLVKWLARYSKNLQPRQYMTERLLIGDADQDQVRMCRSGRQKSACDFDARISGLNGLLRRRKILPDENVDVRNVLGSGDLRETSHAFSFQIYQRN